MSTTERIYELSGHELADAWSAALVALQHEIDQQPPNLDRVRSARDTFQMLGRRLSPSFSFDFSAVSKADALLRVAAEG